MTESDFVGRLYIVLSEGYEHGVPGVCLGDGQTEANLKDMGMLGLASAWATAWGKPIWRIWAWRLTGRWPDGGWRKTVTRWKRQCASPAYAPIPDLTLSWPDLIYRDYGYQWLTVKRMSFTLTGGGEVSGWDDGITQAGDWFCITFSLGRNLRQWLAGWADCSRSR